MDCVLWCPGCLAGHLARCHLAELFPWIFAVIPALCESSRLFGLKRVSGDEFSPCCLPGKGDHALGMVGMSCGQSEGLREEGGGWHE